MVLDNDDTKDKRSKSNAPKIPFLYYNPFWFLGKARIKLQDKGGCPFYMLP